MKTHVRREKIGERKKRKGKAKQMAKNSGRANGNEKGRIVDSNIEFEIR